jgi:hypothetical protein
MTSTSIIIAIALLYRPSDSAGGLSIDKLGTDTAGPQANAGGSSVYIYRGPAMIPAIYLPVRYRSRRRSYYSAYTIFNAPWGYPAYWQSQYYSGRRR